MTVPPMLSTTGAGTLKKLSDLHDGTAPPSMLSPDNVAALNTGAAMAQLPGMGASMAQVQGPLPSMLDQHINDLYSRLHDLDVPNPHPTALGKIGHALSIAGQIAGGIVAPGVIQNIPGTMLNNNLKRSSLEDQIEQGEGLKNQQAQTGLAQGKEQLAERQAQIAQPVIVTPEQAATLGHPELEGVSLSPKDFAKLSGTHETVQGRSNVAAQTNARDLQMKGFKADGTPDESSPVWQAQQAHVGLMQAQAELAHSKNDPNSPAFKQAQQRLAVAASNANAANQRATAYMGNYNLHATGTDLNGNVLSGATLISDDEGNQHAVGTSFQGQAAKAQSASAQFNDVHGALDSTEKAARDMATAGHAFNDANVISALRGVPKDPTLAGDYVRSLSNSTLTPSQRNYVAAVSAMRENIQALRKSAGGSTSDSQVNRLEAMLPNESTPDLDTAMRQLNQVRQTALRLGPGAPQVKGGLSVPRQKSPAAETRVYQGHTYVKGGDGWHLQQ